MLVFDFRTSLDVFKAVPKQKYNQWVGLGIISESKYNIKLL